MKVLKVLGIVALGVGVIALAGVVLGLVAWVLHIVVPLALLFAVGWVAYKVFFSGGASKDSNPETKKLEEKTAEPAAAAAPERKGLSAEEAAKLFDEHRKKLSE